MTVDEAIKYVESAWVPGAAPTILADEVQRLREERDEYVRVNRAMHTATVRFRGTLELSRAAITELDGCLNHNMPLCDGCKITVNRTIAAIDKALRGGDFKENSNI